MNYFLLSYEEALKAKGLCRPNPAVGCVIVKNNTVIAKGHTDVYGGLHAEANAIGKVKNKKRLCNAVMYVTLTPCSHTGNTPPCTDAIIAHNISEVHIAVKDPVKSSAGKSVSLLRKNNIKVFFDFPQDIKKKCFELNQDFFFRHVYNRPFISVKYAVKNIRTGTAQIP
jgi:diaminohydroxyphosphoribosylaminopyrimidine deaminase/5-amino-6-(5-phosphoribosylamino)uracil reductase